MIQTLTLTALMSLGVLAGILALHSTRADADPLILPPALPETDFGIRPSPEAQPPTKTVLVRVDAPAGNCWSATIDDRLLRNGCGSLAFPLEVGGFVIVHFERQVPGDWHFSAAIEADGRVVQTVGPTTTEYPSLDIAYRVIES